MLPADVIPGRVGVSEAVGDDDPLTFEPEGDRDPFGVGDPPAVGEPLGVGDPSGVGDAPVSGVGLAPGFGEGCGLGLGVGSEPLRTVNTAGALVALSG